MARNLCCATTVMLAASQGHSAKGAAGIAVLVAVTKRFVNDEQLAVKACKVRCEILYSEGSVLFC